MNQLTEEQPNWNIEASDDLLANWPIRDVLVALTHAATHLLTDHDCDAHGYEELQHAVVAARRHADLLDSDSQAAKPDIGEPTKLVTGEFAKWWICFPCWKAYYVPTAGHFGPCPDCKRPTLRWPADPNQTLRMLEFSTREWLEQRKSLPLDQVKPGEM